jgi:hypothetical protein
MPPSAHRSNQESAERAIVLAPRQASSKTRRQCSAGPSSRGWYPARDRYALVLDDSDVAVDTSGNTVTLTGHVRTWAEHDAVVDAAWMATGVYDVLDDLYVTG